MANTPTVDSNHFSVLSGASRSIFENVFDLYGTLDRAGNIVELSGRIFEKTSADPRMLVGQPFRLLPYTMFIVGQIYGWRNYDTGLRRFTGLVEGLIRNGGGPSARPTARDIFGLVSRASITDDATVLALSRNS